MSIIGYKMCTRKVLRRRRIHRYTYRKTHKPTQIHIRLLVANMALVQEQLDITEHPGRMSFTFGDQAEQHAGGRKNTGPNGPLEVGLNHDELFAAQERFEAMGCETELVALHDVLFADPKLFDEIVESNIDPVSIHAYVLIVRGGLTTLLNTPLPNDDPDSNDECALDENVPLVDEDGLFDMCGLECLVDEGSGEVYTTDDLWQEHCDTAIMDKHLLNTRRSKPAKPAVPATQDSPAQPAVPAQPCIQTKHARWNLCYGDDAIEPDFTVGQGTVVAFDDIPALNHIRKWLPLIFGEKADRLVAELNYYFHTPKKNGKGWKKDNCGIGYHGDGERKLVICGRLGEDMPIFFRWYWKSKRLDLSAFSRVLNSGDFYAMSEWAVGQKWRCGVKYGPTLRHAAGAEKYTK